MKATEQVRIIALALVSCAGCKCELGDWTSTTAQCVGGVFSLFTGNPTSTPSSDEAYQAGQFREPLSYERRPDEASPDYQPPSR